MERLSLESAPRSEPQHRELWQREPDLKGKARVFAGLTLRALGVVYGDIGTSPLYVFSTLFNLRPASGDADFIGASSIVIWSLILMVTLKYGVFILTADNGGEGGVFAIGGLLTGPNSTLPRWSKRVVTVVMMIGAGLLLGDGAFTPAVSVLGAVGGLSVAYEGFSKYIVIITVVILIFLFVIQPFGTSKIGVVCGPIIFLWFSVMSVSGVWRITQQPRILAAFNPYHGLEYVFNHGSSGFFSLGSIFLALTGIEALYADIGHLGAWPIRVGWVFVALPALILQYLGQGALLLGDPSKVSNPFYYTVPHWAYWPQLVLATFAAIIASQSIITGSFSLTSQAVRLGFAPPVTIKHTSHKIEGQIYVPSVNFILLLLTIAIVAGFGTDVEINNAYGFTVCTTMIFTTALFALVVAFVWRKPLYLSALFLFFLIPDAIFWGSLLEKLPHGGWVAALIAIGFMVLLLCWWYGERCLRHFMRRNFSGTKITELATRLHSRTHGSPAATAASTASAPSAPDGHTSAQAVLPIVPIKRVNEDVSTSTSSTRYRGKTPATEQQLKEGALFNVDIGGGVEIGVVRVPGMWAFFQDNNANGITPHAFEQVLARTRSLPEVLIFVGVKPVFQATVSPDARLVVQHVGSHVYTATLSIGFSEHGIRPIELFENAMQVPQGEAKLIPMERHNITMILGQESVTLGKTKPRYKWLWRWPLVVYEHLKHVFNERFPSCEFDARHTIIVGTRATI